MPSMEERLASLEFHKEEMVQALGEIVRVPAIGPENGGDGEFARSRMIKDMLDRCGFDEVEIMEILDERVKLKSRPNIVARKKGKSDQMVWFVVHMGQRPWQPTVKKKPRRPLCGSFQAKPVILVARELPTNHDHDGERLPQIHEYQSGHPSRIVAMAAALLGPEDQMTQPTKTR